MVHITGAGHVHEIDLLALRACGESIEARHVEVQASIRPVSYISPLHKSVRKKTGRGCTSAKVRSEREIREGIKEWIHKKYSLDVKEKIRNRLFQGPWSFELIVHKVKYPHELDIFRERGILIHY